MPRPRPEDGRKTNVALRLPNDVLDQIDRRCLRDGITRSEMLRILIVESLADVDRDGYAALISTLKERVRTLEDALATVRTVASSVGSAELPSIDDVVTERFMSQNSSPSPEAGGADLPDQPVLASASAEASRSGREGRDSTRDQLQLLFDDTPLTTDTADIEDLQFELACFDELASGERLRSEREIDYASAKSRDSHDLGNVTSIDVAAPAEVEEGQLVQTLAPAGMNCPGAAETSQGNGGESYTLRDGSRPVVFTGVKLAHVSSESQHSLRWTEMTVYRTEAGRFVAHRVGVSCVAHTIDCPVIEGKVLPSIIEMQPDEFGAEDREPCPQCLPDIASQVVEDPSRIVGETDRHWVAVCDDAAALIRVLHTNRDGIRSLSSLASAVLEHAAANDQRVKDELAKAVEF